MAAILAFDGTPTTVISGTGALADANFSTSATATETEFDNSSDLWPAAKVVLSCSFGTAPDDQSTIYLYMFEQDIDSTNDETGPSTTSPNGAKLVGKFKLDDVTTQQYQADIISLFGVRKAKFSIMNGGGQSMDSDFTVKLEGVTLEESA